MNFIPKWLGWIEVISGSMFSGKSEELIRRLRRAQIAKKNILIFKPEIDNRYDDAYVVSHSAQKINAISVKSSKDILEHLTDDVEVVGIDEAQFLDDGLIDVVNDLADKKVRIIIAGLDQDYLGNPFGIMPLLLAIADDVVKTQAICVKCGAPATKSLRIVESHDQILVGAENIYQPVCRDCFNKYKDKS